MSNVLVGQIYQRIVQDVVESSQMDFEEGGVDQATLEDMKRLWQSKLSSLNVASFPWDPTPIAPLATPPTLPSNAARSQAAPPAHPPTLAPATEAPNANRKIKLEPNYEQSGISYGASNDQTAAIRAANLLEHRYGHQAAAQIATLQAGSQPAAPTLSPSEYQKMLSKQQSVQQAQQQQLAQRKPPKPQPLPVTTAQTDGAGDAMDEWTAVMVKRDAHGQDEEMGSLKVDRIIRQKVEEMSQRLEGGGLMLPLRERRTSRNPKKLSSSHEAVASGKATSTEAGLAGGSSITIPQLDGSLGDEKVKSEDLDEDAINSDLDDPDEGLNDNDRDDDSMSQIMLCTYEKVQRVKNKWKCVLKDGVLTVNGKEYVFHKATGEYEW
ncbi:MAG: hypothetical protein M1829_001012 [Trizodia sp. TS-e1964]|nr:MAG: hypothetical protein M1829_001012 [Trizodia sp. TS-e1964]